MKVFTIIKDKSERVRDKNFQLLGERPLWEHLVKELSKSFEVTINTDSDKLILDLEHMKLNNVSVIRRLKKHIDWENDPNIKSSPVQDMLFNFCQTVNADEIVILTHVTSPFLRVETVLSAIDMLVTSDFAKSIHSISEIRDFAWLKTLNGEVPLNFDPQIVQRTQDLQPILVSKGAFFIARAGDILTQRARLPVPTIYYPLNHFESIEIDTHDDLNFARAIKETL